MIVRGALFVLTTIAPFAVSTYYRKTPIFWLPPGADLSGPSSVSDAADPQVWKGAGAAGNWLGPLGWFLSLPSAPKGAVSATVWNMVCGRIIAMATAFLVDIAALFGLGTSSPVAKPGDQTSLRPANPSPALRSIWYSMGLASCSFAFSQFKHLEALTGSAITKQFGGHYQFLTNISLFLTFVTLLLSLSHTLSPSLPFTRELKTLASIMTMPMEVLVSILYWTVLAIDPKLLIPQKRVDDPLNPGQFVMETIRLPLMVDLSMHAFPAVLLLVVSVKVPESERLSPPCISTVLTLDSYPLSSSQDFLAFSPPLPLRGITNSWPIYLSTFSTLAYCLWAEICNSQNGRYPYPLLGVLTTPQRLTLYVGCGVTMAVVLVATDRLHRAVDTKLRRTWSPIKTAGTSRSTGMQTQKQEKVEQGSEKKSGAGETDKTGKTEL